MPDSVDSSWTGNSWVRATALVSCSLAIAFLVVWLVFSRPSFAIMVQVSVALGTGLLGAAAIYQTLGENERRTLDERNRRADRAPHLRLLPKAHMATRYGDGKPDAELKAPRAPFQFEELELVAENVGPGIAGDLHATFVAMYFGIEYDAAPTQPQPWKAPPSVSKVLKESPKFDERDLRLPSKYLPIGPENQMTLLNADDSAGWAANELDEDARAYIVRVDYSDLDGSPALPAIAVVYRDPPAFDDWNPEGIDYSTHSRWYRPEPEDEARIIRAFDVWKALSRPQNR